MQQQLINEMKNYLQSLPEDKRIEAINAFRRYP